jgi:hypothetical protein
MALNTYKLWAFDRLAQREAPPCSDARTREQLFYARISHYILYLQRGLILYARMMETNLRSVHIDKLQADACRPRLSKSWTTGGRSELEVIAPHDVYPSRA